MCEPESVRSASSSSPSSSSTMPSTMAPKKKPGPSAHPSTSKASPPVASNAVGSAEAHEDADAAGEVVGAGSTITTSPAVDIGVGGIGGEKHQQRPDGHTPQGMGEGVSPSAPPPLADGHNRSDGARSGANRRPPAAPVTGAITVHVLSPERVDQDAAPNEAAGPRAPSPHHPAIQVVAPQQRGCGAAATGTVRSRAMVRSTSSSSMPSTTSEAMARAQLLLRFPPAAEQMDEWRATIQSLLGFTAAGG